MTTLRPELNCVAMDSDFLIDNLRDSYLHHPSEKVLNRYTKGLLLSSPNEYPQGYNRTMIPLPDPSNHSSYYYSQYGQVTTSWFDQKTKQKKILTTQDRFLEKFIFKEKLRGGFFLEAGAVDGVDDSNTLVSC